MTSGGQAYSRYSREFTHLPLRAVAGWHCFPLLQDMLEAAAGLGGEAALVPHPCIPQDCL